MLKLLLFHKQQIIHLEAVELFGPEGLWCVIYMEVCQGADLNNFSKKDKMNSL